MREREREVGEGEREMERQEWRVPIGGAGRAMAPASTYLYPTKMSYRRGTLERRERERYRVRVSAFSLQLQYHLPNQLYRLMASVFESPFHLSNSERIETFAKRAHTVLKSAQHTGNMI